MGTNKVKLKKVLSFLLTGVSDLSMYIFKKIVEEYKKKNLDVKVEVSDTLYLDIVKDTFKKYFDYIETQSKLTVQSSIVRYGVHYSIVAWYMLVEYVKARGGIVNNIPLIIEPFENRLKGYPEFQRLKDSPKISDLLVKSKEG